LNLFNDRFKPFIKPSTRAVVNFHARGELTSTTIAGYEHVSEGHIDKGGDYTTVQ
jgi:hypothetical protein